MAGLIRQGHFLGAKLRSLRKRNGLTLDELSARCVQIDAEGAPSVSYLSMVETGKRMPSPQMLDARWFLDENTEVEVAPASRTRGGLEAMPLEPAFLFSHELLQNALPELLSQTGTTGRQFAQLLIRVWQETRHNSFPDIERAAEECGEREMPLALDALLAICGRHGLQLKWFDGGAEGSAAPRNGSARADAARTPAAGSPIRSRFEAPGTIYVNKNGSSMSWRSSSGTRSCTTATASSRRIAPCTRATRRRRPRPAGWAPRTCCTHGATSSAASSRAPCCARESRSGAS
jgi:transcriptional regulator with XRE-family HTH domain